MLADVLHKVAAMGQEEKGNAPYRPRPSSAGPERCLRQMVYHARGEERAPLAGRAVVVLDDSSWHEELTADLIRQSAFRIHSQQMPVTLPGAWDWEPDETYKCGVCGQVVNKQDAHGHIDWIITDLLGIDYLTDHKAINHFGFQRLLKDELPWDYFYQLGLYVRSAQRDNPELDRWMLLVKNKNQAAFLEFVGRYDEKKDSLTIERRTDHLGDYLDINVTIPGVTHEAIERFRTVDNHVKAGTLPERQYDFDHWRCQYCGWNRVCWENWPDEINALSEDPAIAGELADTIAYYRELQAQATETDKEKKEVAANIKDMLKIAGIREGKTTRGHVVKWTASVRKDLDTELIPAEIRKQATIEKPTDRLNIRDLNKQQEVA